MNETGTGGPPELPKRQISFAVPPPLPIKHQYVYAKGVFVVFLLIVIFYNFAIIPSRTKKSLSEEAHEQRIFPPYNDRSEYGQNNNVKAEAWHTAEEAMRSLLYPETKLYPFRYVFTSTVPNEYWGIASTNGSTWVVRGKMRPVNKKAIIQSTKFWEVRLRHYPPYEFVVTGCLMNGHDMMPELTARPPPFKKKSNLPP